MYNKILMDIIDLSITDEQIYEDCCGWITIPGNLGKCEIYIYTNEGLVPHFHIFNNNNFKSCICIYEPLYFNHSFNQDKLNSKQRKILNTWMNKPSKIDGKNNWQYIAEIWNSYNNTINVPPNPIQPDYTNMKNMRG